MDSVLRFWLSGRMSWLAFFRSKLRSKETFEGILLLFFIHLTTFKQSIFNLPFFVLDEDDNTKRTKKIYKISFNYTQINGRIRGQKIC